MSADKYCIKCNRKFYTYGDTCLRCIRRETRIEEMKDKTEEIFSEESKTDDKYKSSIIDLIDEKTYQVVIYKTGVVINVKRRK